MREGTENDLSARIARLARVEPGARTRERVLAAMAGAAMIDQTGSTRPASTPPNAPTRQTGFALAAGVAAVAMLTGLLVVGGMSAGRVPDQDTSIRLAGGPAAIQDAAAGAAVTTEDAPGQPIASIVSLIEASWLLERALDRLPAQRRVMRAGTASTIAALETRIALIDEQLSLDSPLDSEPDLQATLWSERVDVMSALYQVRYSQSQLFSY